MRMIAPLFLFSLGLAGSAYANKAQLRLPNGLALQNDDYQIGSEWGKKEVTAATMAENAVLNHIAHSTAKVRGGGTGFYLGEIGGEYVMATNHHVCPDFETCNASATVFPLLNIRTQVLRLLGSWNSVDFALFTIDLSPEDAERLAPYANVINFTDELEKGLELMTVGFGVANNPMRRLMANMDSHCKVFSDSGDYRFLADPDDFNPANYKAWSFSNGCDISHGDSGSAMLNRQTGEVVGIIWTGRIPKDSRVRKDVYLDQIFEAGHSDVWKHLSYAVPAQKIGEKLSELAADGATSEQDKTIMNTILEN